MRFILSSLCTALFLFSAPATAQVIAPPIWIGQSYPSITFSAKFDVPVISGTPTVIDTVELFISDTTGLSVISAVIRGDSLIYTTGTSLDTNPIALKNAPDIIYPYPISNGYKMVFDNAGIYRAFELLPTMGPMPSYAARGSFRILPKIKTTPSPLLARDSASVQLLIGQEMRLCYHTYHTTVSVRDSLIFLTFFQDTDLICSMIAVSQPVPFGPTFKLGMLAAGTYRLIIEDSVNAGAVTVYDIITVNGRVFPMVNPLLDYMPMPIADASVFAVPAPQCTWWYIVDDAVIDTLWTTSDASGLFTLALPNTGQDFEITVLMKGYYPQTMYLNTYPLNKTLPPSVDLGYELLRDTDSAIAGCEIIVMNSSNAPVESAYVSLYGGREPLICMMYAKAMAKVAAGTTSLGGYTDRQGKISFKDASLNPYIDYVVDIYKDMQSTSGLIRLNRFLNLSFPFTLNTVGVEAGVVSVAPSFLDIQPNPLNASVTITFSNPAKKADLMIYTVEGKLVRSFKNVAGNRVAWNAEGLPSGLYILKAKINGSFFTRKLIYSK